MATRTLLVTGSSGLVGSQVVCWFARAGWTVHGIDNNQRAVFFGPPGDTRWNQQRLQQQFPGFIHHELDVRDRPAVLSLIASLRPTAVVHAAGQPSHDRAAAIPFDDFDTNAVGTLNMLEAVRRSCAESPFVHMSTNKVYGDGPNHLRLRELETRWDYDDPAFAEGIDETFPIDRCLHSMMGASKLASDVLVQEYGRYFGLPTCALRGGCLTGPSHSGVELHGFLSYLVKCNLTGDDYRVFGYRGKQVRDNLHSEDVARFIAAFLEAPRIGEIYNLGGGRQNSCSILEAFTHVARLSGRTQRWTYVDEPRIGDHICYISDLTKMRAHYPSWKVTVGLEQIFAELVDGWTRRLHGDTRLPDAARQV